MDLSVIIPVFNEEQNLPVLFERVNKSVSSITDKYELIFVNDGSRDNSLNIIRGFAEKHRFVKFIDFSRNFGHQLAVTAGLDHASGNALAIIDADLQDPPNSSGRCMKK